MIAPVFVDTNIFVYARDPRYPLKMARAAEWLNLLWREQRGRTSAQVLSEYYSVVTRKAAVGVAPEVAWEYVRALMEWNPQQIDNALLARAHVIKGRHHLDWWDCLLVAAAQAQGCALLLTEDLQDKANYDGVTVCNPFLLSVAEEGSAYSAPPRVASRYRGRGRPRKSPNRAAAASS
jgi:predicted nucleic acid-binding protein